MFKIKHTELWHISGLYGIYVSSRHFIAFCSRHLLNFLILWEWNKIWQNKRILRLCHYFKKNIMKYIFLFMFDFSKTTKRNCQEKNIKCDSKHTLVFKWHGRKKTKVRSISLVSIHNYKSILSFLINFCL